MKSASHYREIANQNFEKLANIELLLIESKIKEMSEKGIKSFVYQWSGHDEKNVVENLCLSKNIMNMCCSVLTSKGYKCNVFFNFDVKCYCLSITF